MAPSPSSSGTIIRLAFLLEALFNILGAAVILLYPATCLSYFVPKPHITTTTSVSLVQWLAALILGLTPQLVLALPNSRKAVDSRPMVYTTLAWGEACLMPVLIWHAFVESGLSPRAMGICVGNLLPIFCWRLYVLWWKPEWFGRVKEVEREKKAQ
ncbi:MAG: hypothetical protein M1820_008178 [Bogoriella megaspora]|nr:MAG: hypothetical protein M1820_008178 [Bogoriella megaspora]